ncbi:uncharacterized protein PV09_02152 [Verruconis gallopava]|uniref:Uncharacterized protein n=1 Tax=Verruconis gallopava TaxID=253628 RepID=A0A0D1Z2X4_9PEZI|nr:uncharacterized protein PV09_02152 [Verruconis gallopava]KIW07302.1 hypothetical protein PV09_02152 [Verruconis gallopava]
MEKYGDGLWVMATTKWADGWPANGRKALLWFPLSLASKPCAMRGQSWSQRQWISSGIRKHKSQILLGHGGDDGGDDENDDDEGGGGVGGVDWDQRLTV